MELSHVEVTLEALCRVCEGALSSPVKFGMDRFISWIDCRCLFFSTRCGCLGPFVVWSTIGASALHPYGAFFASRVCLLPWLRLLCRVSKLRPPPAFAARCVPASSSRIARSSASRELRRAHTASVWQEALTPHETHFQPIAEALSSFEETTVVVE